MESLSTKEKLKTIGKAEFLQHGFKGASLRAISKKAGFTLGAFYGYYPSKAALFEDIVGEVGDAFFSAYLNVQNAFAALPEAAQIVSADDYSSEGMRQMIDMVFANIDIVKLIIFCAAGTKYEDYLQRFIDIEIESTKRFLNTVRAQGKSVDIHDDVIHMLSSAMLTGLMEVVNHNMDKEKATLYVHQLQAFYSAGWRHLLGL